MQTLTPEETFLKDATKILGVTKAYIRSLARTDPDFPKSVRKVKASNPRASGKVYLVKDLEAYWQRKTERGNRKSEGTTKGLTYKKEPSYSLAGTNVEFNRMAQEFIRASVFSRAEK